MVQAFVIMQIGNQELESIYKTVIVPAIKLNNIEPKRVDKHNEGSLLKKEITAFIETSDVIIADLTNARPNCYLEVGYAMGKNKYTQLILTAREDHNPDSPNHKINGQKVHFDLAGYDILWWSPEGLDEFKEELSKRIKRRLELRNTGNMAAVNSSEEWLQKCQSEAYPDFQDYQRDSFMEVRISPKNSNLKAGYQDLLDASQKAEIHNSNWPIGIYDRNLVKATTKGISLQIKDSAHYDYWAVNKTGEIYLLRKLFENYLQEPVIMYNLRIQETAELLLYCSRLYSALGLSKSDKININIKYVNLKNHKILNFMNYSEQGQGYNIHSIESGAAHENEINLEIESSIVEIENNIIESVERLTNPFFVLFDFFQVSTEEITKIICNFFDSIKIGEDYLR